MAEYSVVANSLLVNLNKSFVIEASITESAPFADIS